MKIIELHEVYELEIFPNEIQIFSKPFFIYLNGRSHIIFTPGFCDEKNLKSWRSESKVKVWESPFIPSHLTFKGFKFHSTSHNQSNNQSIYQFIITFQNLEFWDVTK